MKFLDAQKKDGKESKKSILPVGENKMQPGTRPGQQKNGLDPKDPQSLVSSPSGRGTSTKTNTSASSDSADAGVQKLAGELGVDLSTVTGTGPKGVITEKDVRNAKKPEL